MGKVQRQPLPEGWRICDECGWEFKPKTNNTTRQRYCSTECRQRKWHRDKRGGQRRVLKLDGQDIAELVELFDTGQYTYQQLAERFKIEYRHAWQLINQRSGTGYHAPKYQRVCPFCGKQFEAGSAAKVYCSVSHAGMARYQLKCQLEEEARAREAAGIRGLPMRIARALHYAYWRREHYTTYGVWLDFPAKRPNKTREDGELCGAAGVGNGSGRFISTAAAESIPV